MWIPILERNTILPVKLKEGSYYLLIMYYTQENVQQRVTA